jgi:HEAT repeat protein
MDMDPFIQDCLLRLHDPDKDVRMDAVVQLRDRVSVPQVQHALRTAIYDPDGHVRILAAEALARGKMYPNESIPVLMTVLEVVDKAYLASVPHSKEWRRVAAGALGHYGAEAESAVPFLKNALLDPDADVRRYTARTLGLIGPAAIVALQDLRAARQVEANKMARIVYEEAIEKIVQSKHFIVIAKDEPNDDDQ